MLRFLLFILFSIMYFYAMNVFCIKYHSCTFAITTVYIITSNIFYFVINTISIRLGNNGKFVRFSSLGEGYSETDLVDVISGRKEHKPKRKDILRDNSRIDLLSRIDDKIQSSSGGYRQWASVFKAIKTHLL